jgi:hypothetical protein
MKRFLAAFFLFFLFSPKTIFAGNDITITCNTGSACSKSSELPLFSETNIYPGFTHSQIFSVDNNRGSTCHLKLKAVSAEFPDLLSEKILVTISGTNNDYRLINYSLNDLLNPIKALVSLGHVHAGDKNNYLWSVIFDKDAGNEYQKLVSTFDINFNFECDEETTDNPSNISDNPSSNQGTAGCTNSVPDAPAQLIAYRNSDGSVRLNWTETISQHDGYLIAFGPSPGSYQYGAPDVGDVSTYTVNSLTYGAQYCFYVRSLNGCMPGGRTPEYCVNPGAAVVPVSIIPSGFQPGVLGIQETSSTTASLESSGLIAGEQTLSCTGKWLPLLWLLVLIFNFFNFRRHLSFKKIVLGLILSLGTFFIDRYFLQKYCCSLRLLCQYFWIGNLISLALPFLIALKKR